MNALTLWWEQHGSQIYFWAAIGAINCVWLLMFFGMQNGAGDGRSYPQIQMRFRKLPMGFHCIQARNEALNIGDCVQAALKSRWPRPNNRCR